jgi:SAM-dependent methyltransferase
MEQPEPYLIEIFLTESDRPALAYDALYQQIDLVQINSFYLWLFDQFPLPEAGDLLDVSCGTGEVVRLAASRGLDAIGVEISRVVAQRAAEMSSGEVIICVAAGEQLPLKAQQFEIVTNIGSLEHFLDPAKGVREIRRVLKPGGTAVLLVPNTYSLLSNIWSVFRKGQIAVDEQPIQRYGTRADWTALLRANGLVVQKTIKYERPFPRSFRDVLHYLQHPKNLIRLLLAPFIPTNLAYAFLFICKQEDSVS